MRIENKQKTGKPKTMSIWEMRKRKDMVCPWRRCLGTEWDETWVVLMQKVSFRLKSCPIPLAASISSGGVGAEPRDIVLWLCDSEESYWPYSSFSGEDILQSSACRSSRIEQQEWNGSLPRYCCVLSKLSWWTFPFLMALKQREDVLSTLQHSEVMQEAARELGGMEGLYRVETYVNKTKMGVLGLL